MSAAAGFAALFQQPGQAEGSAMETENNEKKPMIRRGSFRVGYGSEEKLIIMCGIGAALCL